MATTTKATDNPNAPYTMPDGELVEEYTPVSPVKAVNPWTEKVEKLAATFDAEAKRTKAAYRFTVKTVDVTRTKSKISTAANAAGYTPQYDVENETKTETRLVLFLIPKITRTVKPKEEESGESAESAS